MTFKFPDPGEFSYFKTPKDLIDLATNAPDEAIYIASVFDIDSVAKNTGDRIFYDQDSCRNLDSNVLPMITGIREIIADRLRFVGKEVLLTDGFLPSSACNIYDISHGSPDVWRDVVGSEFLAKPFVLGFGDKYNFESRVLDDVGGHGMPQGTYLLRGLRNDSVLSLAPNLRGVDSFEKIVDDVSDATKVEVFKQAVGALKGLHDRGLVHGDFKMENILVYNFFDGFHAFLADLDYVVDAESVNFDHLSSPFISLCHYINPSKDVLNFSKFYKDYFAVAITLWDLCLKRHLNDSNLGAVLVSCSDAKHIYFRAMVDELLIACRRDLKGRPFGDKIFAIVEKLLRNTDGSYNLTELIGDLNTMECTMRIREALVSSLP